MPPHCDSAPATCPGGARAGAEINHRPVKRGRQQLVEGNKLGAGFRRGGRLPPPRAHHRESRDAQSRRSGSCITLAHLQPGPPQLRFCRWRAQEAWPAATTNCILGAAGMEDACKGGSAGPHGGCSRGRYQAAAAPASTRRQRLHHGSSRRSFQNLPVMRSHSLSAASERAAAGQLERGLGQRPQEPSRCGAEQSAAKQRGAHRAPRCRTYKLQLASPNPVCCHACRILCCACHANAMSAMPQTPAMPCLAMPCHAMPTPCHAARHAVLCTALVN